MKKICVIGATSAVGRVIIKSLSSKKWNVIAFSRKDIADVCKNVSWRKLPYVADEIIEYCIFVAPIWCVSDYFTMLEAFGVTNIVVMSSTSKYTKANSRSIDDRRVSEKLSDGELKVTDWAKKRGISCSILRPTLIYGGRNNRNIMEISRLIKKFGFFPLVGSGKGLRQPIHAEDLSEACIAISNCNSKAIKEYNLSGGEIISYKEMVSRIFEAMKKPKIFVSIPSFLFGAGISILRSFSRFSYLTPDMADRMNVDMIFEHSEATNDFGFNPRPFSLSSADVEV